MKRSVFFLILFIFGAAQFFCQIDPSKTLESSQIKPDMGQNGLNTSQIIRSSQADTAMLNLELKNARYEPSKNNFPYYHLSKNTSYSESAKPTIAIKKTMLVAEPHASVIKKSFGKYLTDNFEIKGVYSLSNNENLNFHQLFPFRSNASGQVEELIDFEVAWQVTGNDFSVARSNASSLFASQSVLASGAWYKIGVAESGIYKITKTLLTQMGVDVAKVDPTKIRLFGNGGKMIPELNSAPRPDDLIENAIQVVGENDNVFNDNDYILFYATGPTEWKKNNSAAGLKFSAIKNLYSDTSYYYLTIDKNINGQRIRAKQAPNTNSNISSNSYDYYNFHEEDLNNFIKSGRDFYGEYFDINSTYNFTWNDGDFSTSDSLLVETTIMSRSRDSARYSITGNGLKSILTTYGVQVDYYLGEYGDPRTKFSAAINTNSANISIALTKLSTNAIGWLDKLVLNARREINVTTKQIQFRDTRVVGAGKVCNFSLTAPNNASITIWDVTDPYRPLIQNYTSSGSNINFISRSDSLNEYCVAPSMDISVPVFFGKVANQNLHGFTQADYVIVTHPLFVSQAQRIGQLHAREEGLSYKIATTEQIYNEFGGGKADISAIRDFIRMLYSRGIGSGKQVKYVLLMGDGSYKNRTRSLVNNSNLIPTYQSKNSLSPTTSMATDDFFALMDPGEGFQTESLGNVDLGTGRLTCRNAAEMNAIVAKIESYYKKDASFRIEDPSPETLNTQGESNMGDWRNWLMFVGDDKDYAEHMTQSDDLTRAVTAKTSLYNFDKIFLDSYQRVSTPGGKRYPDATEEFSRRLKKGVLIFNYTGHGGEVGLTEERILDITTINNFDNATKLPLFITATCEFSRYDDPERTSAGELCLLNSKGGAVGLLTTCRVAYSTPNFALNKLILEGLFTKLPNGKRPTLGDVIRQTKSSLGQSKFYANFHLLGDPALTLAYPQQKVMTSAINKVPVSALRFDTLGALAKITVSGYVADTSGNKLTSYNGIVYSSVFDKERQGVCLLNDAESSPNRSGNPFKFLTQKNILYRGKSEVKNGDFSFTFIVPKDISFAPGQGRISYYATNGQIDASGSYSNLIVGGGSQFAVSDNVGPQATLYFNDKNFLNGGTTNEKPIFYADLVDSSGINTVGNGIGHDISAVLDETGSNPVILNDYYEANLNTYQSGRVRYPFNELSEGQHRLTFKVWDIQNNSSTVYSDFIVAKSAELALKRVLNYPNPFTTHTEFFFEHNQSCNSMRVSIQIFTISGKAVKTIQKSIGCDGFRSDGIEWDGKDDYGDKLARGVYIYKLSVLNPDNKKAEKIEKLVILN